MKESICTSDTVQAMSWFEECMFTRLITACDDYGRFDARLPILKSRLFPLKSEVTEPEIHQALNTLAALGCVRLYEVEEKPYLLMENWNKHQSIRAKRSKYPPPPEGKNEMPMPRRGRYGHVLLTERQMEELGKRLGTGERDRCIAVVDTLAHRGGDGLGWFNWEKLVRRCAEENWNEDTDIQSL